MDITKYNFEEEFEKIKQAIEDSSFLAIDGEFTGLSNGSEGRIGCFDTPVERYKKLRNGASDFLLLQFGLCAFKANEVEKRYEATPYNFYIFPRPSDHFSPDRRFLCQASSIDFLMSHDFDFNKLFKEGIPYLTFDQEAKLKNILEQKQAERKNASLNSSFRSPNGASGKKNSFVVPQEHKEFITSVKNQIDSYLKSEETDPLPLSPCSAFHRKLIYQTVEQDYPLVQVETKTGDKKARFLVITKCQDENEMEKKEMERQATERMNLDIQLGFTKVMRLVTDSGKLVVGHNMFLDVIHSINHFYGSIPEELAEFKDMISTIFPRLLDTKLMASTNPFKDYFMGTSLEELKNTVKLPPFKAAQVVLPEGFSRYSDDDVFHEAGYDAFVTGSCFASLINFLGRYESPSCSFLLPNHRTIQPFVNKLFMMRIMDIPYINLSGPDVEPPREHVFHVTFPDEWRANDLHQLFEPYGNIQISWLTETTAYVGLMKKENAKLVISSLGQAVGPFQVISYSSHRHAMQMKVHTTPTAITPSATSKQGSHGHKRRSPPVEAIYPPAKLHRKSLTKDTVPYPSIPEEDEKMEEDKSPVEDGVQEQEEEEDFGEPVEIMNEKEDICSELSNGGDSGKDDKLFEEPDTW